MSEGKTFVRRGRVEQDCMDRQKVESNESVEVSLCGHSDGPPVPLARDKRTQVDKSVDK